MESCSMGTVAMTPKRSRGARRPGAAPLAALVLAFGLSLGFSAVIAAEEPSTPPPEKGSEPGVPGAGTVGDPSGVIGGGVVQEHVADVRRMLPTQSLWIYVDAGADSIHQWEGKHQNTTGRGALFAAVREALQAQNRLEERLSPSFPRNDVEWLLITDAVADTLTETVAPLLERYTRTNPEEILTAGRVALEVEMAKISGPPSRLLGFHFTRLANFVYSRADSLLGNGIVTDRFGLEDGILRYMADWCNLYAQGHENPIEVFESRIIQEDWIIARLKDNCGNSGSGTWQLMEQWMAQIPDSSTTPVTYRFAHEYKLQGVKCENDVRVIYIDLPNYREVQTEVDRRSKEGKQGTSTSSPPR